MKSYQREWYHLLPPHVKEILSRLHAAGHQAFIAGGAARDLWLGHKPKDFDLVSEASPEEIEALFPKTLSVGRAFGIMVVVTESGPVEVARFRADGAYADGRHPEAIHFAEPDEDARRRDFTINALFYDPATSRVIDYVDGVPDLEAKVIRAVGDPSARFREDALRMLRAVRFHAQLGHLGFSLAEGLLPAISAQAARLSLVSRERVTQEMLRLFASPKPSLGLFDLGPAGLWEPVFRLPPETNLARFDELAPLFHQTFAYRSEPALHLGAAENWWPQFSAEAIFVLERETKQKLQEIRRVLPLLRKLPHINLAEKKSAVGSVAFPYAWAILSVETKDPKLADLPSWRAQQESLGTLSPSPLIGGKDLLELGFPSGPAIKALLEEIRLKLWNEEISTREEALAIARSKLGKN